MELTLLFGVTLVIVAGLIMGGGAWPMKLMRKFQFEHWWFIAMLTGLIILPWAATLIFCPRPFEAYSTVPPGTILLSNLFSLSWGVANILCGMCFVRIGFALTGAIMTGIGVSLGVTMPMVFKGSGLFKQAADLSSPAGTMVLIGVGVMVVGVVLVSLAGFGRDRELKKLQKPCGNFSCGLIMTMIAGVTSCGISFAFIYSQGPIVAAMKAQGAADVPANLAVWAAGLMGGALVNVLFPIYLMFKNKSWGVLTQTWKEVGLSLLMGFQFIFSLLLMGKGMLWLGALGASVGFGIQQAAQMMGSQGVGFISGEWRGVHGTPRLQMYSAVVLLLIAAVIMAYGKTLAKS